MTYSIPGDYRTKVQTSTTIGDIDSPFTRTRAVLDMMKGWEQNILEKTVKHSYH